MDKCSEKSDNNIENKTEVNKVSKIFTSSSEKLVSILGNNYAQN